MKQLSSLSSGSRDDGAAPDFHHLLSAQITQNSDLNGALDVHRLIARVDRTYHEMDAVQSSASQSIADMRIDRERLSIAHTAALQIIAKQATQMEAAVTNMVQGLAMFDRDHGLVVANRQYGQMYGIAPELLVPGTPFRTIVEDLVSRGMGNGRPVDEVYAGLVKINTASTASNITLAHKGGRIIDVSIQPILGGGWVSTHLDVTEQRRNEAKIAHMATHDGLTNLANRALFRSRLDECLRDCRGEDLVAVHFIDLDRFKAINDTLGHHAGDQVLAIIAERLKATVRNSDVVARVGGDEFAVIQCALPSAVPAEALARRLIDAVSSPFVLYGRRHSVGVSIGIALSTSVDRDGETCVRNADLALYRAKTNGRGKFQLFEASMGETSRAQQRLKNDLRSATANNELDLYYQPIAAISTGKIVAMEALLRWHRPGHQPLLPAAFLPLVEELGLVEEFGEWALRRACRAAVAWPAHICVTVNLSPTQLENTEFADTVANILQTTGLAPGRLELEITESAVLGDKVAALQNLARLNQFGVRIALDDFGSGYSSLSNLQDFPIDTIKLDRRFICSMAMNTRARGIVRTVAALAEALSVTATVEGVETAEQLAVAAAEGYTQYQGNYLTKPVPANRVAELLAAETTLQVA